MSYRKPGPPISRRFVTFTLLLVGVLALFRLYTYYKEAAAPIPPGVTLGGVDLSAYKDRAEIRSHLEPLFTKPIGVHFENQLLVLDPAAIGFTIDANATIDAAGQYLDGPAFVDIAVREAIGLSQQARLVPIRYTYDDAALRAWLAAVAAEHNYAPVPPRVDVPPVPLATPAVDTAPTPGSGADPSAAPGIGPSADPAADPSAALAAAPAAVPDPASAVTAADTAAAASTDPPALGAGSTVTPTLPPPAPTPVPIRSLTWLAGIPGQELDVEASIPVVLAAFASTGERMADLVLTPVPPPPPTMADLEAQLPRVLDTFPVFTAVSVHDLATGERAQADGDAAFSAMTIFRPILALALMEDLPGGIAPDDPQAQQVGEWIDRALGQGDDTAANAALAWYGGGDEAAGARRLTGFFARLGLQNSFIQGGIGATIGGPPLVTPSNQRERPNTRPDANAQTTPDDMAALLGALYQCTRDEGPIRSAFAATITPAECAGVLFYMTHNELRDSLWRGLADYENQWLVHQHGLSFQQHGNAALIWGPAGPYAISIFIYNPSLTDSSTSNAAIRDLSGMIWDFFAFRAASQGPSYDPGPPPQLAPPAGYTPIDQYAPSAANPAGR